jgi:PAS domain S-box-containing protein
LFGFTAGEALGASLDIIVPEHLRERHWSGFDQAMQTGELKLEGKPTLTRDTPKNGGKLYVELSFGLVKNAEGTPIGSVTIARDVTEKVEKERAQRKAQRD